MKYFMHRIQKNAEGITKGVEVHDTLDSAVLSFWSRMKTGYGKTDNTFVACKITDEGGSFVFPHDLTWLQDGSEEQNVFFLHHIRKDGETYDKQIDVFDSLDAAYGGLAEQMEYGYGNTKFPNVTFVHCFITDLLSGGMILLERSWSKPEEPSSEE